MYGAGHLALECHLVIITDNDDADDVRYTLVTVNSRKLCPIIRAHRISSGLPQYQTCHHVTHKKQVGNKDNPLSVHRPFSCMHERPHATHLSEAKKTRAKNGRLSPRALWSMIILRVPQAVHPSTQGGGRCWHAGHATLHCCT